MSGTIQAAEIGVARGETSAALLRSCPGLTLFMVDSWTTFSKDHPYRRSGDGSAALSAEQQVSNLSEAMRATAFAGERRKIIVESSMVAAERFTDHCLDVVFIDADHTYEAVRADLQTWWPKIRQGGILCGHDYGSPRDRRGIWGVTRAVNEFAETEGLRIQLGQGKVWWAILP